MLSGQSNSHLKTLGYSLTCHEQSLPIFYSISAHYSHSTQAKSLTLFFLSTIHFATCMAPQNTPNIPQRIIVDMFESPKYNYIFLCVMDSFFYISNPKYEIRRCSRNIYTCSIYISAGQTCIPTVLYRSYHTVKKLPWQNIQTCITDWTLTQ